MYLMISFRRSSKNIQRTQPRRQGRISSQFSIREDRGVSLHYRRRFICSDSRFHHFCGSNYSPIFLSSVSNQNRFESSVDFRFRRELRQRMKRMAPAHYSHRTPLPQLETFVNDNPYGTRVSTGEHGTTGECHTHHTMRIVEAMLT